MIPDEPCPWEPDDYDDLRGAKAVVHWCIAGGLMYAVIGAAVWWLW